MSTKAYEKVRIARDVNRPTGYDFIRAIFDNFVELHGDRQYADDPAIVGGIGYLGDVPVTAIAIEKGHDTKERMYRSFGAPNPEGYRKALRLMKQAEKFKRPVICFIDTSGAFCGVGAEERGQGQAIAENLMEMMTLKTPIISVFIGEGGSGGALALAVADKVWMLENSIYSVISPEGCASILWKEASPENVARAADCLHITADDMKEFGVAEAIIPEDFDRFPKMCKNMRNLLVAAIDELSALSPDEIVSQRYDRFRRFGIFEENAKKHHKK